MDSILQSEKKCYITGSTLDLHKHHIFFGRGKRALSEEYGCWVWLRADWHNLRSYGVHFNRTLDLRLKRECQKEFEETHSREEFMSVFGRNYLEEL